MNGYTVRKISDLAAVYGEDLLKRIVSSFACRYNDEVDDFLILSALDFAKRRISVTDLVFDNESGLCVGYFTLAVKPLKIPACELSATQRKRIERFAKMDVADNSYTVAAYLIAQFGKNFNAGDKAIRGDALLSCAMNHIRRAQDEIGGQVVFLEMEHGNHKLAKFYGQCGFLPFGTRTSDEEGGRIVYDQMFMFLK